MQELRQRCRNLHCRSKLPTPVENEHHAFCTRGCFNRFYFNRCRVCENDLRKTGKGDAHRLYCRPPNRCSAEARKWPGKYEYGQSDVPRKNDLRSARKMGLKNGHAGHRPSLHCLREWWWWGDDGEHDHSLYDRGGLTIARIVLVDGRYHLRTPVAIPRQSWPSLDAAKRGAETVALWALPNRKRDKIEIAKRPVADWYDRLDGSSDYYNEEGRHIIRLIRNGNIIHLAKPVMSGSWQDRDEAKDAALKLCVQDAVQHI